MAWAQDESSKVGNLVSLCVWRMSLTLPLLSEKVAAMVYSPLS